MTSARPRIAVLDHGMGNLRSVAKALEVAGGDVVVTSHRAEIERSDALCVPGQGIFGRCIDNLSRNGGDGLIARWIGDRRAFLGICLGLQVLFESSEEAGDVSGLALLRGRVTRLPDTVVVPHIGWNTVNGEYFYFDHSYAAHPDDPALVEGWCEHGERFAALVRTGSILGVQFHPEKSGRAGIELLKGWVSTV
ncbi:MAG: imidazole glycerol phosphate synthase subunit HisH [Actinomycetota bacterium]|nr:imidazole glycerol phosphate synthase subunit HisH [Actinomycetota bacterium]